MAVTVNANVLNTLEPVRPNVVYLYVVSPPSGWDADTMVVAVEQSPMPKETTNTIELFHGNESRKYAGGTTYEDLSVTFKSMFNPNNLTTGHVVAQIKAWRGLVINTSTGAVGYATEYKRNGYIIAYSPKGDALFQFNCYGIWPSSFDPGDGDKTSRDDYLRVTCTFTIDKAVLTASPGSAPTAYPTMPA